MGAAAAGLGLLIGVVLGGLGGGGGVLTVPALVYLLGQTAQSATTGSIVIVGITSAFAILTRLRAGIDWRTSLTFGVVGIPAAYLGTRLNQHVSQPVLLLSFAALTLCAAAPMLLDSRRSGAPTDSDEEHVAASTSGPSAVLTAPASAPPGQRLRAAATVACCGLAIGFLTGFLGVGGGFLVVPALVIVLRVPMSLAVGTSLVVVTMNSATSLASRFGAASVDWSVVAPFTVAAVLGTVAGKRIADRLSSATLTRAFALVLIALGVFVAAESLLAF